MYDWHLFWEEQSERYDVYDLCRNEKITSKTKFIFLSEWNNSGMCFGGAGIWIWSRDIQKLATYLLELVLREYICEEMEVDYTTTFDKKCVDLAKEFSASSDKESLAIYANLAESLFAIINDELSVEKLASWLKNYNEQSYALPILSSSIIFDNLHLAIEELEIHENNRGEDNSELSLLQRFIDDYVG